MLKKVKKLTTVEFQLSAKEIEKFIIDELITHHKLPHNAKLKFKISEEFEGDSLGRHERRTHVFDGATITYEEKGESNV